MPPSTLFQTDLKSPQRNRFEIRRHRRGSGLLGSLIIFPIAKELSGSSIIVGLASNVKSRKPICVSSVAEPMASINLPAQMLRHSVGWKNLRRKLQLGLLPLCRSGSGLAHG